MKKFQNSPCPVLVGFRKSGSAVLIYCGRWSCENCAKRLARKWAIRVFKHLENSDPEAPIDWQFLTLTLGSGYTSSDTAYGKLKKLWDRLRKSITRKKGKFQYAAFVEGQPHRANMPHFHIIISVEPPAKRNKKGVITEHNLHDWAVSMGWGSQVKLKRVTSRKAAWYMSKYSSKGSATVPRSFRHVRISRGWYKVPKDPDRKLLVKACTEHVSDFIQRISDETGLSLDEAYVRYSQALEQLNIEQTC